MPTTWSASIRVLNGKPLTWRACPIGSKTPARESALCQSKRSEFHVPTVSVLDFVVGRGQLSTDPAKVQAVADWPAPSSPKELQRLSPPVQRTDGTHQSKPGEHALPRHPAAWSACLPWVEYTHNALVSASSSMSHWGASHTCLSIRGPIRPG